MNTKQSSTPAEIEIVPRRPAFDFERAPRYWLKDPFATHFLNGLSVLVPFSERMVIEVVRKNAARIRDPKLKQECDGLIRQEGYHALLHHRANEKLAACGYPAIHLYERIQKHVVKFLAKILPTSFTQSMPAAFEHFTSAISKEFISNQSAWAGGKSNKAVDFTAWHALEELEHQAVCFDVYKAIGRRPRLITFYLLFVWIPLTVFSIYGIQLYMLHKDRVIYKPRNWGPYFRFVWQSLPVLIKGGFKYLDHHYRPWSDDDRAIYDRHRTELGYSDNGTAKHSNNSKRGHEPEN